MTFDQLRAAHPDLVLNVYAMTPGGLVTLEILTDDGQAFTFPAWTLDAAIVNAFPPEPGVSCPHTGLPCLLGCKGDPCLGFHVPLNQWPETEPVVEPAPTAFD